MDMNLIRYAADAALKGEDADWATVSEAYTMYYPGAVQAKERPRKGKNGSIYTPKKTADCEKAIAKAWATAALPLVHYPIRCEVTLYDATDDMDMIFMSRIGLVQGDKSDLDNMVKTVLDGLNKVAYNDDKQIVKLVVAREYAKTAGCVVKIQRGGLSKIEYREMYKLYTHGMG